MLLYFICHKCGNQFELPNGLGSHEYRCPQCGEGVRSSANTATPASAKQVAKNIAMESVGDVKQWTDESRATISFAALCLLVLSTVIYFVAYHSVEHGELIGPIGVPNLVWRGIALAVGTTVYVLIVVDAVRWRYPFWRL